MRLLACPCRGSSDQDETGSDLTSTNDLSVSSLDDCQGDGHSALSCGSDTVSVRLAWRSVLSAFLTTALLACASYAALADAEGLAYPSIYGVDVPVAEYTSGSCQPVRYGGGNDVGCSGLWDCLSTLLALSSDSEGERMGCVASLPPTRFCCVTDTPPFDTSDRRISRTASVWAFILSALALAITLAAATVYVFLKRPGVCLQGGSRACRSGTTPGCCLASGRCPCGGVAGPRLAWSLLFCYAVGKALALLGTAAAVWGPALEVWTAGDREGAPWQIVASSLIVGTPLIVLGAIESAHTLYVLSPRCTRCDGPQMSLAFLPD